MGHRILLCGLVALGSAACAGAQPNVEVAPVQTSNALAKEISPEDFPKEAHLCLLSTAREQGDKLRLAGVVQYQLARGAKLFESGHAQQGEDVVTGALLLLRHDDELLSAIRGQGSALLGAAHAAARKGEAGRAQVLYQLTLEANQDEKLAGDVREHLAALKSFNESTAGATALEQIGERTRRSLARSVLDPRADAYTDARDDIINWMRAALASNSGENRPTSRVERELALEAYRAIRSGAPAMVALNLRQGTPTGAVSSLVEADLDRALPPGLRGLLEEAGRQNSPDAWLELFRQLEGLRQQGGSETQLPAYVADGAAFWSAIGLYRSSPGSIDHAMPLAMTLVEFGMPEVASTLLSQNSDTKTSGEALSWGLSLVLRGLLELSRTDQLMAARRSYSEAAPLLALAEKAQFRGPSPARARVLMAALETRHGHVDRALPLLQSSADLEPHPGVLMRLAQLNQQLGLQGQVARFARAEQHLGAAILLAQQSGNLLLESQAEELLFRILRDQQKYEQAEAALARGLSRILVLQGMQTSAVEAAAVERQLARLLEYYGEKRAVRAAYNRALEASRSSLVELEITLTEMSRAALTLGDVTLGRSATHSALDLGLPAENSIYIALWQQLLESRTRSVHDGVSRVVLTRAGKARGWLDTLRRFGLGELSSTKLNAATQSIPEKAEADFYLALSGSNSTASLKQIAASPAIDLIEVKIAQDLSSERREIRIAPEVDLP